MKHKIRRKSMKKNYRRIAAAVAGAAVISSTMLPGLAATKTYAAAGPGPTTIQYSQVTKADWYASTGTVLNAAKQYARDYGFNTTHASFSVKWESSNDALVEMRLNTGKIYELRLTKNQDAHWVVVDLDNVTAGDVTQSNNPVDIVKEHAATFGFNADSDRFSLLSLTAAKAIVQVRTGDQTFKVDLVKAANRWKITTIRGIGNGKYPATYTPASLFPYRLDTPVTIPVDQTILFSTNQFSNWEWSESTYSRDMFLNVLFKNPRLIENTLPVPEEILNKLDDINFTKQFVLFAQLGNVAAKGYGIGIERVLQQGNDFIVVVRAKSPQSNLTLKATKGFDYVTIDRSSLDFSDPVYVTFIDHAGTILNKYKLTPK